MIQELARLANVLLMYKYLKNSLKECGDSITRFCRTISIISNVAIGSSNSVSEKVNFLAGPAEHTAKSGYDPAHQNYNHKYKCECDYCSRVRMPRGKPRKEHSEHVFSKTQYHVGKWFRGRSYGCANGDLATVCCQRNRSSQERGEQLHSWGELSRGGISEQCCDWNSHECMERVPQQIKNRKFIREELHQEKDGRARNHIPVGEQVQTFRKLDHASMCE